MIRILLPSLIVLAACAAQPAPGESAPAETAKVPAQAEPQVTDAPPTGSCNAAAAQFAVNQSYTAELAEQARQAAGAAAVRQLVPGQMVTQEYRADRLNLELSEGGKVAEVRCG